MTLEGERDYGLGMDALATVCSCNTNGIMVWAWMLWWPYDLGRRTGLRFGHGCSGHRLLLEHERNYGLGMDALVTVCFWNTNGIVVWAWMLWSPEAVGDRAQKAWILSWSLHGWSAHYAMRGGSSDFEASEGPKLLLVPRPMHASSDGLRRMRIFHPLTSCRCHKQGRWKCGMCNGRAMQAKRSKMASWIHVVLMSYVRKLQKLRNGTLGKPGMSQNRQPRGQVLRNPSQFTGRTCHICLR